MDAASTGLLRALCFFTAVEFPPSEAELIAAWDGGKEPERPARQAVFAALEALVAAGVVRCERGRYAFPGEETLFSRHAERERWFPRKWRRAKSVAKLLSWLPGVRFVAVCNTMAWMDASDTADIDFFVLTHTGYIWQTRGICILPARLLGARPSERRGERDALCFSFFVDDTALDLSGLQLSDDPYFRYWVLSLLVCVDDGIGERFWSANEAIRQRHLFAPRWISMDGGEKESVQEPSVFARWIERMMRWGQERFLPHSLREVMNKDTRVVVNDHVLKFHSEDGRALYREKYYELCKKHGIEP